MKLTIIIINIAIKQNKTLKKIWLTNNKKKIYIFFDSICFIDVVGGGLNDRMQ